MLRNYFLSSAFGRTPFGVHTGMAESPCLLPCPNGKYAGILECPDLHACPDEQMSCPDRLLMGPDKPLLKFTE
jgi:hypothetical protein